MKLLKSVVKHSLKSSVKRILPAIGITPGQQKLLLEFLHAHPAADSHRHRVKQISHDSFASGKLRAPAGIQMGKPDPVTACGAQKAFPVTVLGKGNQRDAFPGAALLDGPGLVRIKRKLPDPDSKVFRSFA